MKYPVYKITIDDTVSGVEKISLVHAPAVESNFLAFDEEHPEKAFRFSTDEEQHIIFGCALRCGFPIYRRDTVRGEYYVVFDKDTIKQINEKFAKDANFNSVNLDHSEDTDGIYMTQIFIKDIEKGINPTDFSDIENGSLFVEYKVENQGVWDGIKDGSYLGMSVEGVFKLIDTHLNIEMASEQPEEQDEIDQLVDEILK